MFKRDKFLLGNVHICVKKKRKKNTFLLTSHQFSVPFISALQRYVGILLKFQVGPCLTTQTYLLLIGKQIYIIT